MLAYVAYKLPSITREARVLRCKARSYSQYDYKQQAFLDFVLSQYEKEGVGELDQNKLGSLLEIKYHSVSDTSAELGRALRVSAIYSWTSSGIYMSGRAVRNALVVNRGHRIGELIMIYR